MNRSNGFHLNYKSDQLQEYNQVTNCPQDMIAMWNASSYYGQGFRLSAAYCGAERNTTKQNTMHNDLFTSLWCAFSLG